MKEHSNLACKQYVTQCWKVLTTKRASNFHTVSSKVKIAINTLLLLLLLLLPPLSIKMNCIFHSDSVLESMQKIYVTTRWENEGVGNVALAREIDVCVHVMHAFSGNDIYQHLCVFLGPGFIPLTPSSLAHSSSFNSFLHAWYLHIACFFLFILRR